MKITIGTLEFEAEPHDPKPPVFDGIAWRYVPPFGPLDGQLLGKFMRDVFSYDCRTGAETRIKLTPKDEVELETDITFWVPVKDRFFFETNAKKSRAFGRAVIARSGLDPKAFNNALQNEFATFKVKVPIEQYRKAFGKNVRFSISAIIRYEHYLLRIPGKRLNGTIAVSFPLSVHFWGFTFKPCKTASKSERTSSKHYTDVIPLLPGNVTDLAITAKAHDRQKPKLKDDIERDRKDYRESKARQEESLKGTTAKTVSKWVEDLRMRADRKEKRLKDFDEALQKQKAKLQDG